MGNNAPLLDLPSGDGTAGLEERGAAQEVRQRGARGTRRAIVYYGDGVENHLWTPACGDAEEFAGGL